MTEEDETSKFKENFWWISCSVLLVSQIVLVILFYNWAGLVALLYIGWIIAIIGIAAAMAVYMQARQDDPSLIERFGDDYRRYMQRVPRMDFLLGIIRLLRKRKNKQG